MRGGLIFAGSILALTMSGQARAETLEGWLEDEFQSFIRACARDEASSLSFEGTQNGQRRTAIPASLGNWGFFSGNREKQVVERSYENDFLLFNEVFTDKDLKAKLGSDLDVPWDSGRLPILFDLTASASFYEDCTTVFGGDARFKFKWNTVKAAITAALNEESAKAQMIFGGHLISPVLIGLGSAEAPSAVKQSELPSRFSTALAVWNWYRRNPDQIGQELYVRSRIVGFTRRMATRLSHRRIMAGEAAAGLSIPLINAAVDGNVNFGASSRAVIKDYAVAYWEAPSDKLPGLAALKAGIEGSAKSQFGPIEGLPGQVTDNEPILDVSVLLKGVAGSACNGAFWKLDETVQAGATDPTISDLTASPEKDGCKFSMTLMPPQIPSPTMRVQVGLKSELGDGANKHSFAITTPEAQITDVRAALSLSRAKGLDKVFVLAETDTLLRDRIEFVVIQKQNVNFTFKNSLQQQLEMKCDGIEEDIPTPVSNAMVATDDLIRAKFDLTAYLPLTAQAALEAGQSLRCSLGGNLLLSTASNGDKRLEFSPIMFEVRRSPKAPPETVVPAALPDAPMIEGET
jgi:hypothetical protein